ncbi:MAG: lipopolysaccharide biosynthesis protein [Lachnospiraceae bacterium]|nr:lipopolysaccharide biosynthesis protein [Lachnospiraceae bacterium]
MRKTVSQTKKDYIWNTAAGLINAAEAVIMSAVVTRITGLTDAGMLTIAFAIGNLMMTVGKFGIRNYQVTDIENKFSFSVYLKTRLLTVLLMIIAVFGYLAYAAKELQYSWNKIMIIGMVCMIYAIEALEDVFWGYYQRRNRLDAGAKMFCFRWLGILVAFPVLLWINRDLGHTLLVCLIVSLILFTLMLCLSYGKICGEEDRRIGQVLQSGSLRESRHLIRVVFSLFGISFLSFYVNNAPKYAIDACLEEETQACYGFVAMPVFVIGLLNTFVYQPTLVPMAVEWESRQSKAFVRRVLKQIGVIGVISAICMTGAYVIGIPVLSWFYHTELSAYKIELMVLMAAGGFLAVSGYLSVVLTIMRRQKDLLWPYGLIAVIAAAGLKGIVSRYGTIGAAVCYLSLMAVLCLIYGVTLAIRLVRISGNDEV